MYAIGNDHTGVELKKIIKKFLEEKAYIFLPISAATTQGTNQLVFKVWEELEKLPPIKVFEAQPLTAIELDDKLLTKRDFEVTVEDGIYFVEADWIMDILRTADIDDYESLQYFQRALRQSGIIDKLEEMGIEEGDTVSIYDFEFYYVR